MNTDTYSREQGRGIVDKISIGRKFYHTKTGFRYIPKQNS